ncbi:hypothetical protein BGZ97_009088 [Linnemannia gamsii]|uniref:Uncharacterized protein n=1 Tax=Linnemannia gamsii TaxID=64522 RepID=A0A9P6R9B5_9FUNG|nr:hypothetical protein BGZ97_009088 [Linnemannia gamsii]
MADNRIYRNDEVEGIVEEHVFSSEDERGEPKSDDRADQEQLAYTDSDEDTDIESDISDSEEELDAQIQESTKYSKRTIKNYAKFRLLNVDRRWGRNIEFILMMFDWIQKSAIFACQRRLARSSTCCRLTRAEDVLDRSVGVAGMTAQMRKTLMLDSRDSVAIAN